MQIFEALKIAEKELQNAGAGNAYQEARRILSYCLDLSISQLLISSQNEIEETAVQNFLSKISLRAKGMPTAHITGRQGFYNEEFIVNEHVLIPRPETELIVTAVLEEIKKSGRDVGWNIVDLGSGSGCIGLSILKEYPQSDLVMVEASKKALDVSKENAEKIFGKDIDNIHFVNCSVEKLSDGSFEKYGSKFDFVVSNPPYISTNSDDIEFSVKNFEPHQALFGGEMGWELYEGWSKVAYELLVPGGLAIFEIGYDQGEILYEVFLKHRKWSNITVEKDLAGHDRVLIAKKG